MKKLLLILLVALYTNANAQYTLLTDFTSNGAFAGANPGADLNLITVGGALYGMTYAGGLNGLGTIFKIMPDGTGYEKLLEFAGTSNGSNPMGDLIYDGTFLYGITERGGTNNLGTIFKIMPDGTGYVKLLDFVGANGSYSRGTLIYDGTFLYGMTGAGGTFNLGTLYKIMPNGTGYIKLIDFAGTLNGSEPYGSLTFDGNFLYGMTVTGGTNGMGTVFKILPTGTGYVKLLDFNGTNGYYPEGSLFSDGNFLYGMTSGGGTYNKGTLFKILLNGTGYAKLINFSGLANGSEPYGSLIFDGTFLYGMTRIGGTNNLGTLFKILPNGSGYVKLLDFAGVVNGSQPYGSLFFDGTFLFGMTMAGGISNKGTLFKILPDGTGYVKLFDFTDGLNGSNPLGSLISDGTFLYGTTYYAGNNGKGTLFKILHDGTGFLKLFDFADSATGSNPGGALFFDGTFLYGTTAWGGTNGLGTVFKIMPDGTGFVKLIDFAGMANGSRPWGALISDGTYLYGTTSQGGLNDKGTLFKIMPDGTGFVKFFDFALQTNGIGPNGSLVSDGTYLYGTTLFGGANNMGVVFKILPNGTGYTKILVLAGATNGNYAHGSLIFDGTFLYGMTTSGGTNSRGTIFKIMPNGTGYVKLYDFTGSPDGSEPSGDLISDGTFLYGMTSKGGLNDEGTFFKIMPNGTGYIKLLDFTGTANGSNPYSSITSNLNTFFGVTYQGGAANVGTIFRYCFPVSISQSLTICQGQSITVGTNIYSISGTYTDSLTSKNGCDSTVTTNLTVLPAISNSVTIVPATCGNNNGSAAVSPSGGGGGFTFLWSTSDTTSTVTGLTGSPTDTLIVTITDANGCTFIDTAIVNCLTGVDEWSMENHQLIIYPNPNNGQFTIITKEKQSEIRILNTLGEIIFTSTINRQTSIIDISHQPIGIYFFQLKSENGIETRKIIKQ